MKKKHLAELFGCGFDGGDSCSLSDDEVDRTGQTTIGWTIQNGSTPSKGTGPSSDQAGTGQYALFESSFPTRTGQQAR